ncbi:hypothetical protein KYI11_06690 [Macrococcoides bohemicum]|uniref:Uncharacterized protein n=2 Tax=Macrococcoides bohemicum TaxID=1903056 RepID=A0AAE7QBT4_9STAP|nr:hypothetical protein HT586_06610 [Macrococcus bohemicus]QYA43575.1 hypothetical protein KYI11_06690 [Macrococcus bohemicus]QYA45964.1 hypothetical protein KYI13_06635 [Macrococcus bohemicus]
MMLKIILIAIFILLFIMSGPIIKWVLSAMSETKTKQSDNVGLMIGYIERLLILMFIAFGEYTAIGLVIASKSILRFNDLKDDKPNYNLEKIDKTSEYILLGTMLSLLIGVVLGLILRNLLLMK